MRTIFLLLALVIFACKKEDPKPVETPKPTPAPKTETTARMKFNCKHSMIVDINWDSDPGIDTTVKTNTGLGIISRTVKQQTISMSGFASNMAGDTTKVYISVSGDGVNWQNFADTVFTAKTFTLW